MAEKFKIQAELELVGVKGVEKVRKQIVDGLTKRGVTINKVSIGTKAITNLRADIQKTLVRKPIVLTNISVHRRATRSFAAQINGALATSRGLIKIQRLRPSPKAMSGLINSINLNLKKRALTLGKLKVGRASLNSIRKQIQDFMNKNPITIKLKLSTISSAVGTRKASRAIGGLNSQIQRGGELTREFGEQAGLTFRRFLAYTTTTRIFFALASAIREGFNAFVQFDRELVRIQQITRGTDASIAAINKQVRNLAASLGVSSQALVTANRTLLQAGVAARDIAQLLPTLAQTELAPTFDDIASTTEGLIAVMSQFNLTGTESASVLNSINAVAANFAVESKDLLNAFRRAGGAFVAASGDIDDSTQSVREFLALFTSVRATTRETAESIATGLRTIFTRIQRSRTLDLLQEFNINLRDVEGNFIGPLKAVRELNAAFGGITGSTDRFRVIEEIGGFRQVSKLIPLITQFSVAQEALAVATFGTTSLQSDQITAQKALEVQFTKLRESFNKAFEELIKSDGVSKSIDLIITLTDKLIGLISVLERVAPAIALAFAPRLARGALALGASFGGGLLGGAGGGAAARLAQKRETRARFNTGALGTRGSGVGTERDFRNRRVRGFGPRATRAQRFGAGLARNRGGIAAGALIGGTLLASQVFQTSGDTSSAGIQEDSKNRKIQGTLGGAVGGGFVGAQLGGPGGAAVGAAIGGIIAFAVTTKNIAKDLEEAKIGEAIDTARTAFNSIAERLDGIVDPQERRAILQDLTPGTLGAAAAQVERTVRGPDGPAPAASDEDGSIRNVVAKSVGAAVGLVFGGVAGAQVGAKVGGKIDDITTPSNIENVADTLGLSSRVKGAREKEVADEFGFFENIGLGLGIERENEQQRTEAALRRADIKTVKDPALQELNRQTLQTSLQRGDITSEDLDRVSTQKFDSTGVVIEGNSPQAQINRKALSSVDIFAKLEVQQEQYSDSLKNTVEAARHFVEAQEQSINSFAQLDTTLEQFNNRAIDVGLAMDRISNASQIVGNLRTPGSEVNNLTDLLSQGDRNFVQSTPEVRAAQEFAGGLVGAGGKELVQRGQQENIGDARTALLNSITDTIVSGDFEASGAETRSSDLIDVIVGDLGDALGPDVAPLFISEVNAALESMGDGLESQLRSSIASGGLIDFINKTITNPTNEFLQAIGKVLEQNSAFVLSTAGQIAQTRGQNRGLQTQISGAENKAQDFAVDSARRRGIPIRGDDGASKGVRGVRRSIRDFRDKQVALRGATSSLDVGSNVRGADLEDSSILGDQIRASRERERDLARRRGLVSSGQAEVEGEDPLEGQAATDRASSLAFQQAATKTETQALIESLKALGDVQGIVQATTNAITDAEKKRTDQSKKALDVLNQGFEQQAQVARGAQALKSLRASGAIDDKGNVTEEGQEQIRQSLINDPTKTVGILQDINAALSAAGNQDVGGFLGTTGELTGKELQTRFGAAVGGNLGKDQDLRNEVTQLEQTRIDAFAVAADAFKIQQIINKEFAAQLGLDLLKNQDEFFNRLQGFLPTAQGQTPAAAPATEFDAGAFVGLTAEQSELFASTAGALAEALSSIPESITLTMAPISIAFTGLEGLGNLTGAIRETVAQDILDKLKNDPNFAQSVKDVLGGT